MLGRKKLNVKSSRELQLHFMLLPGVVLVFLMSYAPMLGIFMAFQKFVPAKGFLNQSLLERYGYVSRKERIDAEFIL